MPKLSEKERIAALEAKLKQLKVVQQRAGTETCDPGRRKLVPGACGKNFLFFTPRTASSRPHCVRSAWPSRAQLHSRDLHGRSS
jgi:hypothetical protein